MNSTTAGTDTPELRIDPPRPAWWLLVIEVTLIFGLFWAYAGQGTPHVNETHYLTKAKHFWNPAWCRHDPFLTSSNPHLLFYMTFGWLTVFFPLATVAWIGRIVTWLLLAFSWRRLSFAATGKRYLSVLTAAVFLMLLDKCHLAGEWIVGGVEAKGFAFGFVFWGLAAMLESRWSRCWILFGVASAFHVLVGGWSCLAAMIVFVASKMTQQEDTVSWRSQLIPLFLGSAISLMGILPPVLANREISPEDIHQANSIMVTLRLSHHQWFGEFETLRIASFFGLIFVWLIIVSWIPRPKQLRSICLFAIVSLFIGLTGIVLSGLVEVNANSRAVDLLIFYWFRLSDFAVPLAATFTLIAAVETFRNISLPVYKFSCLTSFVVAGALFTFICTERWSDERPFAVQSSMTSYPGQPKRTLETYQNWQAACEWIRTNTQRDSKFLTPARQQTFKWYAHRAEVVSWKDVPQDVAGIFDWYSEVQRLNRVQLNYPGGIWAYTDQQLLDLGEATGATHLISLQSDLDSRISEPPKLRQLYPENPNDKVTFVVFELKRN